MSFEISCHLRFHLVWSASVNLNLSQISIEWFRTLKPVSGRDGMGGYLRLTVCLEHLTVLKKDNAWFLITVISQIQETILDISLTLRIHTLRIQNRQIILYFLRSNLESILLSILFSILPNSRREGNIGNIKLLHDGESLII